MKRLLLISLLALLPFTVACSPSASVPTVAPTDAPAAELTSEPSDNIMDNTTSEQMDTATDTADTMSESDSETTAAEAEGAALDAAADTNLPLWQTMALTNARSGESFTLGDFAGKTVYVEPMATWCTNCRQQLNNLRAAQDQLDPDNVALVALSVETNLTAEQLAQYADNNSFNWTFAVLTPELLTELVNQFGRAITSPPSTPHFIIRADGTATELATGIKSSESLVTLLQAESQ